MTNEGSVGSKKRSKRDFIIVVLVIIIAIVVTGTKIYLGNKDARDRALISQLLDVRMSVQLYIVINKTFPPDLRALTTTKYKIGDKEGYYLTGIKIDRDKYPIDSYGYRFNYDRHTGFVTLAPRAYEGW